MRETHYEIGSRDVSADLERRNADRLLAKACSCVRWMRYSSSGLTSAKAASYLGISATEMFGLRRGQFRGFSELRTRSSLERQARDKARRLSSPKRRSGTTSNADTAGTRPSWEATPKRPMHEMRRPKNWQAIEGFPALAKSSSSADVDRDGSVDTIELSGPNGKLLKRLIRWGDLRTVLMAADYPCRVRTDSVTERGPCVATTTAGHYAYDRPLDAHEARVRWPDRVDPVR